MIAKNTHLPTKAGLLEYSKFAVHRKFHSVSKLAFEDHRPPSFSGLLVFQALYPRLDLKRQLNDCFRHLKVSPIFSHGVVIMMLIAHSVLGYRQLHDVCYYHDDPLVKRTPALTKLPDVATLGCALASMDSVSAYQIHRLNRDLELDRSAPVSL